MAKDRTLGRDVAINALLPSGKVLVTHDARWAELEAKVKAWGGGEGGRNYDRAAPQPGRARLRRFLPPT